MILQLAPSPILRCLTTVERFRITILGFPDAPGEHAPSFVVLKFVHPLRTVRAPLLSLTAVLLHSAAPDPALPIGGAFPLAR